MAEKTDLLKGTLDLLVLRILARDELHGWGITQKLELLSSGALRVDEGSLYPLFIAWRPKVGSVRRGGSRKRGVTQSIIHSRPRGEISSKWNSRAGNA